MLLKNSLPLSLSLCLCLAGLSFLAVPAGLAADKPIMLRDQLNHQWDNELVTFPISKDQENKARKGKALVDSQGVEVLYQLVPGDAEGDSPQIAFVANLKPYETLNYTFADRAAAIETDLKVEETDDLIRLSNGKTGISLRKHLVDGQGPIEGLRLKSGNWTGGSRMDAHLNLTGYTAEVTASGKAFAEVLVKLSFEDNKAWRLKFRLQAGEPVVLVDETFSLGQKAGWTLFLQGPGFSPDKLYYRSFSGTKAHNRGVVIEPLAMEEGSKPILEWDPWVRWWEARSVKWFGVWDEGGKDFIVLGARDSERWVDPARKSSDRTPFPKLKMEEDRPVVSFSLYEGERRWLIGALDAAACLATPPGVALKDAPLPQQYVIKNEFPLDRVKDYVLQWDASKEKHPHLFIDAAGVKKLREGFKPDPAVRKKILKEPFTRGSVDEAIPYYLGSGDAEIGNQIAKMSEELMTMATNGFLKQGGIYSLGFAPHMAPAILAAVNSADAVIGSGLLNPEEIERLRAQAAFIGYTLQRPDYWSPERGFAANPNMTTMVSCYQTAIGSFIPTHPNAGEWVAEGLKELTTELHTWSDGNGGWLEAPHYAMVSYDYILGALLMARNSGFDNHVFDPKFKLVMQWFANISTPPDSRLKNLRHLPPIGNTYRFEPSGEFGLVAGLWKERDPGFASEMQWMHRQQGSRLLAGVGGRCPVLTGYRKLLMDPAIPEKAPSYKSELFPETGVVLRNQYPSDRETMLYMIAGRHYQHYDFDSGSVTLWGKGRVIADEFGYNGRAPVTQHSMVESAYSNGLNMRIKEFAPSRNLDYVKGVLGGWTRQIAFVKDADPLGPNFFLICDTLKGPAKSTWRLWLATNEVAHKGQTALFVGEDDVDADIRFLLPSKVQLETEALTIKIYGLDSNVRYGQHPVTLTGLIAKGNRNRVYNVLIYPRLKSEKKPVITPLAEGRGVKVESPSGTDYVFLSRDPFTFKEERIAFEGTVGAIQIRGDKRTLSLGEKGSISVGEDVLKSDKAASRTW